MPSFVDAGGAASTQRAWRHLSVCVWVHRRIAEANGCWHGITMLPVSVDRVECADDLTVPAGSGRDDIGAVIVEPFVPTCYGEWEGVRGANERGGGTVRA